eukprot:Skav201251  [mRNA]  locus=scaffold1492:9324:11258:+ [translate_table: standard]
MESGLRIVCLTPSATDICVALGLRQNLVGVTHECDLEEADGPVPRVMTKDVLREEKISSQDDIHRKVKEISQAAVGCKAGGSFDDIPSLYPIDADALVAAQPTLIITQDLCQVCAPSSQSVSKIYDHQRKEPVDVLSLSPQTLEEVVNSFRLVASAAGFPDRGHKLADQTQRQLRELQECVLRHRDSTLPTPRMYLLEWLSPPFDAGHWMPDMMQWACVDFAATKSRRKSGEVTWQDVAGTKPDLLLVACCGFDLDRNYQDALAAHDELASVFQSADGNRGCAWATDGDQFFARPGPKLLQGAVIMALCAYHNQPKVLDAIKGLKFAEGVASYKRIPLEPGVKRRKTEESQQIPDIEDFFKLHEEACQRGETFYTDPSTGFLVFTEVAHRKRGKCCGSGCRHCPYNHANVRDEQKLARIQQPAILFRGTRSQFSPDSATAIRVLFFSGGKDSFLTIRALAQEASSEAFCLVLLTTFDAPSRIIAHQDISIDVVQRQAKHLGLTLLGIPMHRGSSESYVSRVNRGLQLLEREFGVKVKSLVFGDLHLEHIKSWRESEMSKLGYELEFPLWHSAYDELERQLIASEVPVLVSSSTIEAVQLGQPYDQSMRDALRAKGIDVFGEGGEFHTVVEVWNTEPERALGLTK